MKIYKIKTTDGKTYLTASELMVKSCKRWYPKWEFTMFNVKTQGKNFNTYACEMKINF